MNRQESCVTIRSMIIAARAPIPAPPRVRDSDRLLARLSWLTVLFVGVIALASCSRANSSDQGVSSVTQRYLAAFAAGNGDLVCS
jgi:hypothetical protein